MPISALQRRAQPCYFSAMTEYDEMILHAPFTVRELDTLPRDKVIGSLSIVEWRTGASFLLTSEHAKRLAETAGIKSLYVSCDVSRAALQHMARIPGLETLDIEGIRGPGSVRGLEAAIILNMLLLRNASDCKASDIRALIQAKGLRQLLLQNANISTRLVRELATMPELRELDLEATIFDDSMAEILTSSNSLQALYAGNTRLTRKGLRHLAAMKQLKKLDLWGCGLSADDLIELEALPNLEYLAFGTMGNTSLINAEALISTLERFPALKEIWLDTVDITPAQIDRLKQRYEKVRVDLAE